MRSWISHEQARQEKLKNVFTGKMNFKNIKDLSDDIEAWIPSLPARVDCVVGVPRSGMLVANILALKLDVPLTDLDGFLEGRIMTMGNRFGDLIPVDFLATKRRVLVVDDSISSGRAIREVHSRIEAAQLDHEVVYGCLYGTPKLSIEWLHCGQNVAHPRRFEWNIFSTYKISKYCFDMDGVLCQDPDESENDDGERYLDFIRSAKPLYVPAHEIGYIVTSRLEKYRTETEEWLARNGVRYRELKMLNVDSIQERKGTGAGVRFKASFYRSCGATLFIESNFGKAQKVARLSGLYVYAVDKRVMVPPVGLRGGITSGKRMLRRGLGFGYRKFKDCLAGKAAE